MSTTTTAVTHLHEFLSSAPSPLIFVLIRLAPYLSTTRNAVEILSWSRSYDSWLALAAWWACILSLPILRYLLPIAVVIILVAWPSATRFAAPLVTENSLQTAIADLTTIQSLLPNPIIITRPAFSTLVRIGAILYGPYLLLTYYVPLHILIALVGTVAITWNSPWAIVLRNTLAKSAWVRWGAYSVWYKLSGETPPQPTLSFQTRSTLNAIEPGASLRFIFTVYENQRWWVGIDYSGALLPTERPSWSSANLQPVSPPNAFILPEPTSVYLRDSTGNRVKRTATWKWEESEWKVLVRKEDGGVSRVEKPMPSEENSSLLMKAAGKMKEASAGESDHQPSEKDEDESENEDIATDLDGWVYGDNKWEGRTSKGGMGKYTRYRRWTRVAVVNEVVEVVEEGDTGIERQRGRASVSMVTASPVTSPRRTEDSPEGSPLRQRLKSALTKGTS